MVVLGRDGRLDRRHGLAYLGAAAPGRRLGHRRGRIALADLAVTVAVMATTPFVQTPPQLAADAPVMGSIWTPCAVLACALAFGVRGGLGAAVAISATLVLAQATFETELGDIELIVLVGLTVGYAADGAAPLGASGCGEAVAAEAAMRERERLARAVHDGVLQVLGYVRGRGAELGGPAGELGVLAGEQEYRAAHAARRPGPSRSTRTAGATSPPRCGCSARRG